MQILHNKMINRVHKLMAYVNFIIVLVLAEFLQITVIAGVCLADVSVCEKETS